MNKNTIISLGIILVFVAGLVWWSKSVDSTALGTSGSKSHPANAGGAVGNALTIDKTFYDFGTISMKNGNTSEVFTVSNVSDVDISIKSVVTSCMCTNAFILKNDGGKIGPFGMPGHGGATRVNETIKAGESVGIEVVYDPNAHGPAGVGTINRFIEIEDENGNKLQFEIKANVTP